jgi:eukaryotic-like serine/threonine-protein kinase
MGKMTPIDLSGRTLAHYRLTEKIGAGGMGIVYSAEDIHLDRRVAVKVLPAEAVADPDRRQRFVQEAKSASALNHPNIIHIYDIDRSDDVDFMAMELVAGKTLGELIGRKGLPISEALKFAVQIADALAAAHGAGIVHRDLKPANIMVSDRGLVKILDFGLAKLLESAPGPDLGATRTRQALTGEGSVLGTDAYMSPEQAEGKNVDARSDIFSFGSVLYEMISGRRAFQGDSKIATLSAVCYKDPPPIEGLPLDLEKLIGRCLRKEPDRRFQHMADVRVALHEIKEESDSGKLVSPPPLKRIRSRRPIKIAGAALGVLLIAVFALFVVTRRSGGPSLKDMIFTQLTESPGPELLPSLSPDGGSFVYQSRAAGNWDIYFQRVGGKTALNLTKDNPVDDIEPAYSPDGERIAFRSERLGGGIFIMGATGESVRRLTDFGQNPAWSPDGKEIACSTAWFSAPDELNSRAGQLFLVNVATGEKRLIPKPEDVHQPHWSPHGGRIAYWGRPSGSGQRDLWTVASTGGDPLQVTNDAFTDWDPVWSPDGRYLYFASDRGGSMNLWRVPISEKSGKVRGPAEPVTTPASYSGYISFSRDGRRMLYAQKVDASNLCKVAFDPERETVLGPPAPITQGSKTNLTPALSPDGQWVAYYTSGKHEDIFLVRTDGTGLRQITDDPYKDRKPLWSPDGKLISFFSDRSGKFQIWTVRPDGSGLRQMTDEAASAINGVWSPDGTRYIFRTPEQSDSTGRILIADASKTWTEQKPEVLPVPSRPGTFLWPWSWSPDGRRLALHQFLGQGGTAGLFVYDFDSHALQQVTDFGFTPNWLADSRRLLFNGRGKLYLIDSANRRLREILSDPFDSIGAVTLSRDNRTIVFLGRVIEADVWLATLK